MDMSERTYLSFSTAEEKSLFSEYVEQWVSQFYGEVAELLERCESPIERLFAIAMWGELKLSFPEIAWESMEAPYPECEGTFFAQAHIGPYRADFMISIPQPLALIVECDRHGYHDRTKEQARRDRQRDRWFQTKGYIVLRFAGSEIVKDPQGCAKQVRETIYARVF